MKKPSVEKIVEIGSILLTATAGVVASIVTKKQQKKLIDEAVVKHLTEKK